MSIQKTILHNGVTVITEQMESVRSVALGIWFKVGSRDELAHEAGLSHFIEHMMFKGTPTHDARGLSEAFDRLGAQQNAFTSKESTCYFASFIDESLPEAFALLSDMVCNATFDEDACALEREVVIEEIARSEDDPEDQVVELFYRNLWPSHTIGLPIGGTRDSVASFDREASLVFRNKHYTGGNCVVAAAGNLEHEQLVELAIKHLEGLPGSAGNDERIAPQVIEGNRQTVHYKDTEQAHLMMGTTTFSSNDDRRFTLSLLNTAFGGTMSSRLFQEIREKQGLVYAVYSRPHLYQGRSAYTIYAGTRPDNANKVIKLIESELSKIAQSSITTGELDLARQATKGGLALSLESTSKRMLRLGDSVLNDLEPLTFDVALQRLDEVTVKDVATLSAELAGSPLLTAVVGPFKDSDKSDESEELELV
ncbi:MAG: insulinase family protein [Coriobacteriia bacterium]|nr:insulinase family protein [Coriobacteriia bacterium]MCL2870088.1 insulinase family protein [Coriobacteriia bacterium]